MAGTDDDGGFSDDELDALVCDDFLALEDQAILQYPGLSELPQAPQRFQAPRTSLVPKGDAHGTVLDEYGLHDEAVEDPRLNVQKQPLADRSHASYANKPAVETTQRERWRLNRFTSGPANVTHAPVSSNISLPHRNAGPAGQTPSRPVSAAQPFPGTHSLENNVSDVEKLQAELQQLRIEKEGLQNAIKAAKDQLLAKTGEISIVRSNQTKAARDYETRIEELQKLHIQENEKHRLEIEQARKEREKLVTHNQFLDHERNDQTWQVRRAQKDSAANAKGNQGGNDVTPKKPRSAPFGDGFNEDEVAVVSPSKAAGKGKTALKAGSKRKRDVLGESPVQPLDFSETSNGMAAAADNLLNAMGRKGADAIKPIDGRFKFLQQLLDRRIGRHEKRTFETLANYMFPSDQRNTLSGLLIDQMTPLSAKDDLESFPAAVGQIVLSLWSRCLQEAFYEPVRYFMDLMQFILFQGSMTVASSLMDELVDLAQRTADINIIPRYKRFKRKTAADNSDNRPLNPNIDTQECLQFLELTVTICSQDDDLVKRFWRSMRFDFISMLLRNSQDLDDIQITVKLLQTSVRADSFAMIVAPPASQSVSEQHVIDRLSSMLIEVPRTAEDEKPYTPSEISHLRLEILSLVEIMCTKRYCGKAFAKHPSAISRLVRVMHDELNNLYEWRHGHELHAELVNGSTRMLYHLTTAYASAVGNLQEKLRAPPTSVYKHLIVLSRLAFSEGTFFEAKIEEDVLDCAHQMLEELVTPEEGEALQKAFVREERQG